MYPVRGHAIVLHNITIGNQGPLQATRGRIGDVFGPRDGAATPNLFRASAKARNNTTSLVRLDDFIIGFAERGEMVLNAPVNQAFESTFEYENIGAAGGGRIDENESGAYQLEIRTSADYGTSANPRDLSLPTVPSLPPIQLGRTYDTNDRLTKSYALTFTSASQIADGSTFSLSDGVNTATFEFDVLVTGEVRGVGVRPENIRIQIQPNSTDVQVARAIRDAINSTTSQQRVRINASTNGDMTGASPAITGARSRIIQLHGQVSADVLGGVNYSAGGVPLSLVTYGADVTALGTDFGEDLGDANVAREQGQLILSSSVIRDSSGFGVNIDAAGQNQSTLAAGVGLRPYPGVARNLITLNTANVSAGIVAVNNLITGNRTGGINISGDTVTTNGIPTRSMARIVNNTLYGPSGSTTAAGTGININEGAIPTLLNNIIASFTTGVQYTGPAAGPQPELGGNIYQGNTNNITPASLPESFGISLLATDPLFVNSLADRFYLRTLSRAIDSSLGSLENRSIIEQVKEGIGIPTSPIIAPSFDLNGLRRSDDPLVNTPAGQGQNVFIDRGAIDRVDFIGPSAVLALPIDNDAAGVDFDPSSTYLQLLSGNYDFFEILLDERSGTGVDPTTLNASSLALVPLILTENGRRLIPGNDFIFGYSVNSRTIRLTPLAGFWRQDSVYEITLVNRTSVRMTAPAGNSITDGQRITFNAGSTPVVLEFDTGNGVGVGAIAVPFASNFTSTMVAGQILKALNQLAGLGVDADAISNDTLLVHGVSSVVTPFSGTVTIAPITDFAGNNLQANRSNALTQFTIAMPETSVDYGDAIERSGTGANSSTVLSRTPFVDGARHVLYPIDEPLLVLGRYADGDSNGIPSNAADADDNDSSIDLSSVPTFSLGNNGPVRLTALASTADLQNKFISISDDLFNVVTFQFKHDNSAVTVANAIPVSVAVAATANEVALALRNAIHNEAIVKGRLFGISAQVTGNVISVDASASHLFDLSGSVHNTVPFIQRQPTGSQTIQVRLPANDAALANGLRTFTMVDGSGNTVVFQIVDRSAAVVSSVLGRNVPVFVNMNPIASPAEPADTDATFATKVAAAINGAIASRRLNLPSVTASGNEVRVLADDEDGVSFRGYFNAVYNTGTAATTTRPATAGVPVIATITASNAGFIDAWIDWNQDNDFEDTGERIINSQPAIRGSNLFNIITPSTAIIGYTTARFRLSATGGALATGMAVGGEVEDHLIEVVAGSPPVAVNDSFTVNENGRISSILGVATPGILANDFDADDQNSIRVHDENRTSTTDVSMQPLVAPRFGTLELNPDGSFTYTPKPHFTGVDTFVYRTTDSRMVSANAATVTLTVHKVNDDPKAFDDVRTIDEDTVIEWSWSNLTANDFAGITTLPQRTGDSAGLEILGHDANGVILTGASDIGFGSERDQNLNIVNVRLLGSARLNPNEVGGLENVSIVNPTDTNRANRRVRYAPGTNYNNLIAGPVLIEITIEDEEVNLNGAPAANNTPRQTRSTLTVNINAMNDRPTVVVNNGVLQVNYVEDVNPAKSIPVSVWAGPLANPTAGGADDENGLVLLPTPVAGQNVSFNTTAPDVTRVRALDPTKFLVQPTIALATGSDVARTLSFTLAPDVNSEVSGPILIEIFGMDDGQLAGAGALGGEHFNESLRQTLTLNVAPVNDSPFATDDIDTIDEDIAKIWPTSVLLRNDYAGHNPNRVPPKLDDEDVQTLRIKSVQLINLDGSPRTEYPGESLTLTNSANPELRFTPGTNYNDLINGPVLVLIEIEDDGVSGALPNQIPDPKTAFSTLTININAINDRPVVTVDPNRTKIDPTLASSGVLWLNVMEDPGQQVIPVTVNPGPTGIVGQPLGRSGGADDELGLASPTPRQSVTFTNLTVRALRPELFSVQPAIVVGTGTDVARNLTFTLAPDVNFLTRGVIEIEIFGIDNGATGNGAAGGVHQAESLRQTLSIRVSEVNDPPVFDLASNTITLDEDAPIQVLPAFYFNEFAGPPTAIDELPPSATAQTVVRSVSVPAEAVDLYAVLPTLDPLTGEVRFQYKQDVNSNFASLRGVPGLFNLIFTATDDGRENGIPVPRSTSKTVSVTVNPINDAPFYTLSRSRVEVIEDAGPVTVAGFATNVRQAFNLLNGQMTAADEANQILTFNMNFSNPSLFSTPPAIDALGALTFRTAPHQNGTSVITARLVDDGAASPFPNNNLGPVLTFTISVQAINDAPEFSIPTNLTVNEDAGVVSIPGFATDIRPGPAAASDENRQSLTFNVDSFDPNLFEVAPSIQPDGTLSFRTKLNVNSSTPGINRVITFQLQDGGLAGPSPNTNLSIKQTFTLDITPVNDPPVPNIHTVTDVLEDSRITVLALDVLAGDVPGPIDEVLAGQTVRMTQIAPTSEFGGTVIPNMQGNVIVSFDYIPPPNLAGVDTIRYVVTDNGSPERSATGTIVIRPIGVNDPPQFTPGADVSVLEDAAPYSATWATNILAGPPDESGQIVSFVVAPSNPSDSRFFTVQPSISSTGVLTFTLAKDVNGVVALDVYAVDNGGNNVEIGDVNTSPTHRMTVSIGAVNDPAGFVMSGSVVVDEDSGPYSAPFLSKIVPAEGMNSVPPTATDESSQTVTILVTNSNSRLFAVQPTIDANGRLTFTPADNAFGTVLVFVEVVDNGPSSPPNVNTSGRRTFSITLTSKNDNPIANADQYSTTEDALLTVSAPGLLANDVDPDLPNDVLSVLVPAGTLTSIIGARVVLNANGSFTYDPRSTVRLQELRAGETIVDSFTYTIGDSLNGTSNIASVAITVTGVNDAPVAVNDSFQVAVGTTTLLDVLQNDRDVDSAFDLTSIEIGQLPANGIAIALPTGRVEFRSAPGFVGVNTFTYRVRDSLGALSNEATVTVNTSIPPVAGNDVVSTVRNRAVDIDVLRNDSDPDSNGGLNPASVTIVSPPTSGSALVLNDGKIRYTPVTGFVGVTSLQYTVADITGQVSNVATVTIQVLTSLFQNPDNRLDVDDDGFVSAIDVLVLVNDINENGQRVLPESFVPPPFLDVNGDGSVSSLDVLEVVNFINSQGNSGAGEGEGESVPDLDWKPINVEIMSTEEFTQTYKNAALRESMMEFDLSLAKTLREEFGYGPLMANEEGDEPESLADYLAVWEDMENDEEDLDDVFANGNWL
ncbi:MAG: tandem-95 repeat protein [Pirellula sp.]